MVAPMAADLDSERLPDPDPDPDPMAAEPTAFSIGDLVWGKVKSHPWWPGAIFDETLALHSVAASKPDDGHELVAFFGDDSYGWLDPADLVPFEPHFHEKSKQAKALTFVAAVEEAVEEVRRRAEREGFEEGEVLDFVRDLAVEPSRGERDGVEWIRRSAVVIAYRKWVFEEVDFAYAEAFAVDPSKMSSGSGGLGGKDEGAKAAHGGSLVITEDSSEQHEGRWISTPSAKNKRHFLVKRNDETHTSRLPKASNIQQSTPHRQSFATVQVLKLARPQTLKDTKIPKRPREDLELDKLDDKRKKLKERKDFVSRVGCEPSVKSAKSLGKAFAQPKKHCDDSAVSLPRKQDLGSAKTELLQRATDMLLALAADPFYGDCGAPSIVSCVFLNFRSLVYNKSLDLTFSMPDKRRSGDSEVVEEAREQRRPLPLKPAVPMPDGRVKNDHKRSLSDRLEEKAAKRLRKLMEMEALAAGKKAMVTAQKTEAVVEESKPNRITSVWKQEPRLLKRVTPTFLIMNFPPNVTLPSKASLKARFGGFGPLNIDAIEVHWRSLTCRVLFKFRSDAEAALHYAKSHELFGHNRVRYLLREIDPPAKEEVEVRKQQENDQFQRCRPSLFVQEPLQHSAKRKSCLKKLGDDDNESVSDRSSFAKESSHVKFQLGGDGGWPEPEPPAVMASSSANVPVSLPSLMDSVAVNLVSNQNAFTKESTRVKFQLGGYGGWPEPPAVMPASSSVNVPSYLPPSSDLVAVHLKPVDFHLPPPPPLLPVAQPAFSAFTRYKRPAAFAPYKRSETEPGGKDWAVPRAQQYPPQISNPIGGLEPTAVVSCVGAIVTLPPFSVIPMATSANFYYLTPPPPPTAALALPPPPPPSPPPPTEPLLSSQLARKSSTESLPGVDFLQKMLGLLCQCSKIVDTVSQLGYGPCKPL